MALPLRFASLAPLLLVLAACGGRADDIDPLPPGGGPISGPTGAADPPSSPTSPTEARTPASVDEPLAPSNVAVPFHLVVSNQSFEVPLADIDVFVDGTHVVTGDFPVGNQHSFYTFDFPVHVGRHELRAVTKKGGQTLTTSFEAPEERWGILMFWTSSGTKLSFDIQATQPMFQ